MLINFVCFRFCLNRFSATVKMDDTDGYFVVGGGKFIRGIEGFYGPVTYYRTRTPSFKMVRFTFIPNGHSGINIIKAHWYLRDFLHSPSSSFLRQYGWWIYLDGYNPVSNFKLKLNKKYLSIHVKLPQRHREVCHSVHKVAYFPTKLHPLSSFWVIAIFFFQRDVWICTQSWHWKPIQHPQGHSAALMKHYTVLGDDQWLGWLR